MMDPSAAARALARFDQANISSSSSVERHRLAFSGSGSEYFRIWIVNLLLTLVTLGLYYPWAKVRKLKYLYGNTHVAGHALDFHGSPKQMLKGYLLMMALFAIYTTAGKLSPVAGGLAGMALAALWPWLLRASLRFRLANTSWRGLRFHFTGTTKRAYGLFAKPLLIALGLGLLGGILLATKTMAGAIVGGLALISIYALMPYFYHRFKRYQHENYAYAQLQTEFRATAGEVGKVWLKTAGVSLLGFMILGTVIGLLVTALGLSAMSGGSQTSPVTAILSMAPFFVIGVIMMQIVPIPYFQSRMQNLLWSQTGSPLVRFKSDLAFWPLLRQSLLNWILIVATLGLYWPFALIALTRLKVQAITIHMKVSPDALVAQMQAQGGALGIGDAAADLAGIDIGL